MVALIFSLSHLSFAETIVFKSGKTVEADIIEKRDEYIKIDIAGIPLMYYFDEIETIDGVSPDPQDFLSSYIEEESDFSQENEDVKKLLQMTGALKIGQQISEFLVAQMTEVIKNVRPDIDQEILDVVAYEIKITIEESMNAKGGYVELAVKLHRKYYTHDETKRLIKFYQSELGKKVIKTMPIFLKESMAVGQVWGQSLEPIVKQRVLQSLQEKGIEVFL